MPEEWAQVCLGRLAEVGLSGSMVQGKQGSICVLEEEVWQAELSKSEGVRSSFSGQLPQPQKSRLAQKHQMAEVPLAAKEAPETTATPQLLSEEDMSWDADLYQDSRRGDFWQSKPPWVSDTVELPFLDPMPQEQAVSAKHMEDLKEKKKQKQKQKQMQKQKQKQKHIDLGKLEQKTHAKDPAPPPQCLGPGCVYPTRPGSKYCSDDCGMKLAADRIYEILPQRIQQWQTSPCIANEQGKKMLERIHREKQDTYTRLKGLECQFHELEAIILRGKQQAVCNDEESNKGNKDRADPKIFCVSCGQSINMRMALRHMERCFAKYECQSSFGSLYPTSIEGTTRLFCDVYDPKGKRYCKRLQVLCPEHSRDPKVSKDEVCGCPLVHNVFEFTGNFCCLPKHLCDRHYCWEKLRRAEVDLERLRALHKLEELCEEENKIRNAMTNRAGLLALMLHQTVQHDPLTTDLRSRPES
ncbi:CXXC-type zinc finger protein 1-like [Lemur catta]|uniref:CXXC-type zinc finger protein 1-like n=1 Tax=Lemur catta TaxID=9447 RepID=UPI001E26810C|nr:CXXC-type zinc finger protein 1-like [Lemur catta]